MVRAALCWQQRATVPETSHAVFTLHTLTTARGLFAGALSLRGGNPQGTLSTEQLIQAGERLKKRLGGQDCKAYIEAVEKGDLSTAAEIVTTFYDKKCARWLWLGGVAPRHSLGWPGGSYAVRHVCPCWWQGAGALCMHVCRVYIDTLD